MSTTSKFMKSLAGVSVVGLAITACADDNGGGNGNGNGDGGGEEITISVFSGWEEGIAVTYLWEVILEEEGYEITQEESDAGVAYAGLSDGSYDFNVDAWLPITHEEYWDDYGDELEDLGSWNDEAYLTVAVNEDAPVDSLEELAENADEFGDTIYGIEPGSGLDTAMENAVIPDYGLEDMDYVTSSTPAMIAELDSHIEAGENVVVTLWRPHWTYGAYSLKDLEDPEGALGDEEGIHIVARDGFSEDHPEVAEWLEGFEMDTDTLSDLLETLFADEDVTENDYRELVEEWIAENQDYVDGLTG